MLGFPVASDAAKMLHDFSRIGWHERRDVGIGDRLLFRSAAGEQVGRDVTQTFGQAGIEQNLTGE
ncbi:hypothetical protein D7I43_31710 [Micromonospora globbae]|uniref:Uncharacterized protein n=1 Tax=Micromonospora globbae TaxID=1894969 RepID=A0A420EJV4_9ACTN|nr:hypothetical protein D7I43_31710 [Micromonospora globbae]